VELAAVLLPALRPLRLLRLLSLLSLGNMLAQGFRRSLAAQAGELVAVSGVGLVLVGVVAVPDAERGKPGANIKTPGRSPLAWDNDDHAVRVSGGSRSVRFPRTLSARSMCAKDAAWSHVPTGDGGCRLGPGIMRAWVTL